MRIFGTLAKILSCISALACQGCAENADLLAVGVEAPDFRLQSHIGDTVTLSSFRDDKFVVLIFYPGDQTPVCTKQLCAIRDDYSLFVTKNAAVFGVNYADEKSHLKFAEKNSLDFPLLIDTDYAVTAMYGAKGSRMAIRTVYVIGPDGKIVFAKRGRPSNAEILAAIPVDTPDESPAILKQ